MARQPKYPYGDGTRCCTKCGESKTVDQFNHRASTASGRDSICRECLKKYRESRRHLRKSNPPAQDGIKVCKKCGAGKDVAEFQANSRCADGRSIYCRFCTSIVNHKYKEKDKIKGTAYRLRIAFNLTLEDRQRMKDEQGGVCAVCGNAKGGQSGDGLVVDHDHDSGKVRALLCHKCNIALGHVDDNIERLDALKAYLMKYRSA